MAVTVQSRGVPVRVSVTVVAGIATAVPSTSAVPAEGVWARVSAPVAHTGLVTVLESRVMAAPMASSRPSTATPVFTVMALATSREPANVESTPSVAELPTCQNTLQAWAPLTSTTWLFTPVMSVDPAWKTKTAFGSPSPSSVSVPPMPNDDGELWTPVVSVRPPRSVIGGQGVVA